jgi:hypothetical protein
MPPKITALLGFALATACGVTAYRAYKRGVIHVGDDGEVEVKRVEKPKRYIVAFVTECVLAIAFLTFALVMWFERVPA